MNAFYDFEMTALDGSPHLLRSLKGKVALAVNVASKCGYTPQYEALQELYAELKDKNFTIIGFPCNQFGAQEPGSAGEIQSFCSLTYGVTFPLSAKIEVNGPRRHPLYAWLTAPEQGFPGDIGWNFEKFLIEPSGKLNCRYPAGMTPADPTFLQDLGNIL